MEIPKVDARAFDNKPKMIFELDSIEGWEFHYKDKVYKLNVEEVLRFLDLVKNASN